MKHFLLVYRDSNPAKQEFINRITEYLTSLGADCIVEENPEDGSGLKLDIPEDCQCILSLGGDGNLVRVAQNTFDYDLPLVGINQGHLGYLCEIEENNLKASLKQLVEDEFAVEDRMMLAGFISEEGVEQPKSRALNDIVIVSPGGLEIINLTVYVNGKQLYSYNCDGMIFSTPTGSTAYNLSANGPIVDPGIQVILLTPINAHTLNSRSIVLSGDATIQVELNSRDSYGSQSAQVSFDGAHKQQLRDGQRLTIYRSKAVTKMIQLDKKNFLERIRSKLQEL